MKRPTFLEGVGVALMAGLLGSLVYVVMTPVFGSGAVLKLLIAALAFGYLVYLLRRSPERVGRITFVTIWGVAAAAAWLLELPLLLYLALHLGLIWLARSLYFYSSVLSALTDLGLTTLGLAAALWAASHSHSLFLGIWSLFLVQALFAFIPASLKRRDEVPTAEPDRFDRAHRAAEAALRKLSSVQ